MRVWQPTRLGPLQISRLCGGGDFPKLFAGRANHANLRESPQLTNARVSTTVRTAAPEKASRPRSWRGRAAASGHAGARSARSGPCRGCVETCVNVRKHAVAFPESTSRQDHQCTCAALMMRWCCQRRRLTWPPCAQPCTPPCAQASAVGGARCSNRPQSCRRSTA